MYFELKKKNKKTNGKRNLSFQAKDKMSECPSSDLCK